MLRVAILLPLVLMACSLSRAADIIAPSPEEKEPAPESSIITDAIDDFVENADAISVVAPVVGLATGSINELGAVQPEVIYPGDSAQDNVDFEAFITFDLSVVPQNVHIKNAFLSFDSCVENGNPFSDPPFGLGALHVSRTAFGELDGEDYARISEESQFLFDITFCPYEPMSISQAVRDVADERSLQLRLSFDDSNDDNIRDDVVFEGPTLIIEYVEREQ